MKEYIEEYRNVIEDVQDLYFDKDGEPYRISDIDPDSEFLQFAREYDKKHVQKRRKEIITRASRVAALFIICFVTISAVALEKSDAFRSRIYNIIRHNKEGAVTLFAQDEYDMIGKWVDYWYPKYMPVEFILNDAEDKGYRKTMVFCSDDAEIHIVERTLDAIVSMDSDQTTMEEVRIGYYYGYLFTGENDDYIGVYWMTDDKQISVTMQGEKDREMLLRIAENMEYRK